MKKTLVLIGAFLSWFAVIAQFYLMMENRVSPIPETVIRFFSFFTILTNSLVAVYFTSLLLPETNAMGKFFRKPGKLTSITVYITVVGLVYQLVLRWIWEPAGMQKIVDEMLHSVIPVFVILFWWLWEEKQRLDYKLMAGWLIYPFVYLVYILFRGTISGFYPYPFVDVDKLGYGSVMLNSLGLLAVFLGLSFVFISIGKKWGKNLSYR